jgi:hypothetical protein
MSSLLDFLLPPREVNRGKGHLRPCIWAFLTSLARLRLDKMKAGEGRDF